MRTLFITAHYLLATMFAVGAASCYLIPNTPEAAFHDFQTNQHKESWMVAPLCAAGESVIPIVIEKVKNRKLERRVYALGFLGTTESESAADVLEVIARDDSEDEGIRNTALKSLFMIDETRGRKAADEFKDRMDYVGKIAREILTVNDHPSYRQQNSACNITD